MHAVQPTAYGNPVDGLEYVELPEPAPPGANEVLVAAAMIASGQVHLPVAATYALSSIKRAVAHAQRGGKVLLNVAE